MPWSSLSSCYDGCRGGIVPLREYAVMRGTIDMPDALLRKTKALAALRGSSIRDLTILAVEREVNSPNPPSRLDLSGFDFDDLFA
jgi:hypothetical protein